MDRRSLLQRIAAAAGASFALGSTLAVEMAHAAEGRASGTPLPSALMPTLSALAELIIPTTDTPGAVAAGVPEFVAHMAQHWMGDAESARFSEGLQALETQAQQRFGTSFDKASPVQQADVFGALRETIKGWRPAGGFGLSARVADPAAPFFHKARDLVAIGYFTSEVGINAELAYVRTPGRFDGDVDVKTWNKQMQL
jgi:gluconate 2-dehydrogenase gamma chain